MESIHQQRIDSLMTEQQIYNELKASTKNAKKLIKAVTKLIPQSPQYVQDGILAQILVAKDPVEYFNKQVKKLEDFKIVIKELMENGCHGMIIINEDPKLDKETIYPAHLDTRENWLKENQYWDEEQEMLIQHELAEGWMKEHNKGYFFGKVVLFKEFGFSGVPRIIEMKCTKKVQGLRKYPGTNYYY